MSDGSGWRDPFEDEERARERETRRAERENRRRGKSEGTRKSLAERVREQLGGGGKETAATPSTPREGDSPATPEAEKPQTPPAATPAPTEPPGSSAPDTEPSGPPSAAPADEPATPVEPTAPAPTEPSAPAEPPSTSESSIPDLDPGATDPWEVPDPSTGYPQPGDGDTADHPQSSPDDFWDGEVIERPAESPTDTTDSRAVVPPPVDPHPDAASPEDWPAAGSRAPRRKRSTIWRRRIAGLVALLVLIGVVGAAAYAIHERGNNTPPPVAPVKPRKTQSLTIPEGYTRKQMAAVAKKAKLKGDYLKASDKSKKIDLAKLGAKNAKNLEGFLFPATYELYKNASAQDLVDKQLDAFQQNFDGIDMKYAKSKNLTPYDVTIIASMVQSEAGQTDDFPKVASVIYNRLKDGTPLGIDATIRYEDDNYDKPLVQSRLDQDTPYNTRTNTGLPPGPISNPGLAALKAAANPAKTDYLYYVTKTGACGELTFAKTQAEFDQAAAAYNNAREAAGGKSPTTC